MIKVAFENSFKKSLRKKIMKNSNLFITFLECFQKFVKDPFDISLRTHKLSGKLKDLWAFSIEDE